MFKIFFLSSIITSILLIWFKTNFIYDFFNINPIRKLLKFKQYEKFIDEIQENISYIKYIRLVNKSLIVKLITCPICLSFWLSIIICYNIQYYILIPMIYVTSLILFYLVKNE